MKKQLTFLFAVLLSMVPIKSLAHDIAVANSDGKTIYYIFTKNNTELAVSCRGDTPGRYSNEYSGNVVIPESVIYNGMTYSVTSIGVDAFGGCTGIISITIPNSVKSIGKHAFWGCTGLTSVAIPNSVTNIGDQAFDGCSGLPSVTVPNSVTSIGEGTFYGCSALTSVTIPNSVTSIGGSAFSGCSNLASVTIPNSVTSIGGGAFYGTAWYNNQPNGLIYAGKVVYTYKGDMPENTKITLNEGTLGIADYAFRDCSCLTSVTIPNSVTSIGQFTFWNCTGLTSVAIPNNVTSINQGAFSGCSSLTSITIPNSVTSIGQHAFLSCKGLTSITIPNSVTSIGQGAFLGCSSLASVTIPNNVTSIGYQVFCECSSLTSVTIPNSITSIDSQAFMSCYSLSSVIIPNSVTSIGERAFKGCSSLASVTIGKSVTNIADYAFYECSGLTSVHMLDIAAWCNIKFADLYSNPLRYAHHLYLNGNEVKDVAIPNSVTNIRDYAFLYCSSMTSVTIPNSVTSIGESVFSGCSSLISATISNNVTTISNYLFQKCSRLTSINVPNGVTSIGSYAFDGCYNLSNLTIPQSITTIGEYAFQNCSSLATVTIPKDMQIIKRNTFTGCSSLKSITIPAKVEYIYQEAFANCYGIENVNALPSTPPFLYDNSFSNFSVPLKVPKGCKEAYQTAQGWKNFTSISDADKYNLIYKVDNEVYKSYEIEEGAAITPEPAPTKEGYTFSGWSEIPETMPAHDVTITGSFTINKYKLTYTVDGEEYKSFEIEYGASITPEPTPTKEGYTFSGWSDIPETMPAHDVTVTGSFTVNQYTITYIINDEVYTTQTVDYGSTIIPPAAPEREGYDFAWADYPETMPAYDITIYGTYTTGIEAIMAGEANCQIFSLDGKPLNEPQKGVNIVRMGNGQVRKVVVK